MAALNPRTLLLILFLLPGASVRGESVAEQFEQAGRHYEQGQYREAIQLYGALLKDGLDSAALRFNLGNACFKNGELGRAVFHYRAAAELAPRDPDISANLRFARDRVTASASITEPGWSRLARYFTLNELSLFSAVCFWTFLLLLGLARLRPALRPSLKASISTAGALCLAGAALLALSFWVRTRPVAIATQRQLVVHLGPLSESQTAFTVPDGTELRIQNRREDWLQVADRSGRTGWVEAGRVAVSP